MRTRSYCWKLLEVTVACLISIQAWALPNDRFGRTVTLVTASGTDTYTDTDPNNSNQTFSLGFPQGTDQNSVVYPALNSIAPPPSTVKNYAGLDANSIVLLVNMGVTQAIMDALVSGGTIASYTVLDPGFPPPPLGAVFAGQGVGQGNFGVPTPYLPLTPSNWPVPPPPNTVPMALDRLANRLATVNPTVPARALNSTFTPNPPSRIVFACYSIHLSCSVALGQTCTSTVQLVSDASTPPTTVRSQTALSLGGTLVVGLTLTNTQDAPLCYIVPSGHNVRLNSSSAGTGTATASIVQQTEEVIH